MENAMFLFSGVHYKNISSFMMYKQKRIFRSRLSRMFCLYNTLRIFLFFWCTTEKAPCNFGCTPEKNSLLPWRISGGEGMLVPEIFPAP
jgi:hypothetical protein